MTEIDPGVWKQARINLDMSGSWDDIAWDIAQEYNRIVRSKR